MSGNTLGHIFKLTTFGESHGKALGGILDGVPPGIVLDLSEIQKIVDRRKPGNSAYVTSRKEEDQVEFLSGLLDGTTTGTPLMFIVNNTDQRSKDYDNYKDVYRPGHGDMTYDHKYGIRDHRGGGRASARETVSRVIGGAVALQILKSLWQKDLFIRTCVVQLGKHKVPEHVLDSVDWDFVASNPLKCPCPNTLKIWQKEMDVLIDSGKSVGANVYMETTDLKIGLGAPVFDKLDADLAKAWMSINAVKSVCLGKTFDVASADQGFDEMQIKDGSFQFNSNRSGGTLAGISTGQPIVGLIGFKPTSSNLINRKTINSQGGNVEINISGRHDPCVALRAGPIVEAMTALTLLDHYLLHRAQCGDR